MTYAHPVQFHWRPPRAFTAALAVLAAGCGGSGVSGTPSTAMDIAAKVAQTAAAITDQSSPIADAIEAGHHIGFDTDVYPGDITMRAWKDAPGAPYSWVGFYLPGAPCHKDTSWSGKRDSLRAMGWGLAVVYVGEQTWGKTPRPLASALLAALRKRESCNANLVNGAEGIIDANDAAKVAAAQGFPNGTVIFLDLERMDKVPPAMRDYYTAWVRQMLASGTYQPGVYVHQFNAQAVNTDISQVFRQAGVTDSARFWIAGGKNFDVGRAPQDVGFAFAGVWQGVIDAAKQIANIKLPVDVSVASWVSPSETGIATH